jgi:hypothetical protein
MIRRGLPALIVALALSSSAFAYEEAQIEPAYQRLYVGETYEFRVRVRHVSGLNYTMWRFVFEPDRFGTVDLKGTLDYAHPIWNGEFYATALTPGTVDIVSYGKSYAKIEVVCPFIEPVQPIVPAFTAKSGESVKLAITTPQDFGRALQWYEGRVGDTSKPIDRASGADLEVISTKPGIRYVWVSSKSPCASSNAEFRIDVLSPRRRAVGVR